MKELCVLIPAYNEARTIGDIIKKIKALGFDAVVVDDGSTDGTARLAEAAGAFVMHHDANKGKGASLREGIRYALDKSYDSVVIMDGDGQHNPEEIRTFLRKAREKGSSFIVGNRMRDTETMPIVRFFTNRFMSLIISIICRQRIPDTQCGYKFISRDALNRLSLAASRYDIETEMLIEASRAGIKIDSVPIRTIYKREESNISPVVDTFRFMRLLRKKLFGGR